MPSVSVLIPCYKRPEYTRACLNALHENTKHEDVVFYLFDDASGDETPELFEMFKKERPLTYCYVKEKNEGLRDAIIDFFRMANTQYLCKIDNDCLVPGNWLKDLLIVHESTDVDILSPNVYPSNAGLKNGRNEGGYLKVDSSHKMGGLWLMERELIKGLDFEKTENGGIGLAHSLIEYIHKATDCNAGWTDAVTVQDIGHWSGAHPEHIKSDEHFEYSQEVGRGVAWA